MLTYHWLAQIDQELQIFRDAFVGSETWSFPGGPWVWAWTLSMMGLVIAGWTGVSIIRRDRTAFGPSNRRICLALGLESHERKLLKRVAKTAGFKHVASILISEGCFEYASSLHVRWRGSGIQLDEIRSKVFDP